MKLKKKELARCYYEKMLLFAAMGYYNLKESEKKGSMMDLIDRSVEVLLNGDDCSEMEEELSVARKELEERVDVLTACVDRLSIYQYALNRIELRFEEQPPVLDEEIFLQKTMEYIFSSKDTVLINELIREILGQLPVRMTKGKYFERIKNALLIYQGTDKASLDSMLYTLRTGSMLYHPKKEGVFYTEYQAVAEKLGKLDFSAMTKELHKETEELLDQTGDALLEEMDLCMLLAEEVNYLYALCLLKRLKMEKYFEKPEIKSLFSLSRKLQFAEAEKALVALEGCQERLLSEEEGLERGLFEADLQEEGIRELQMVKALGSDSLFMDFTVQEEETVVNKNLAEQEADTLIEELRKLFSENSMLINRAIMANTLSKLPVFFESSQEVMEYIQNSLEQCHDLAEKTMSMKLIYHMMEG